jgi:hypothetical protein
MTNKWINLEVLTYAINKIKTLINNKADKEHNHIASDVKQDATHRFVNDIEKDNISKIITDGTGDAVLHNDGVYKELANANTIDDLVSSGTSTYSSKKINIELNKKANAGDLHTHDNKNILDDISLERFSIWNEKTKKIITTGNGDKYLADDGTYKVCSGGSGTGASDWSELNNKPFNTIDATTLSVNNDMQLTVKRVALKHIEYKALIIAKTIDSTTLYIITDEPTIYYGAIKVATSDAEWHGTRAEYETLKSLGKLEQNITYYTTDDGDYNDNTCAGSGASDK